jgi:hypothetical protein
LDLVCPHCFLQHPEWHCVKCDRTATIVQQRYQKACATPLECGAVDLVRGQESQSYEVFRFATDPNKALLRMRGNDRGDLLYSDSGTAMHQACSEARRRLAAKLQEGFQFKSRASGYLI